MPARRWPLAVLAALAFAVPSFAQDKPKVESEAIQFETADGVQLQGTMYKALMTGADKIVEAKADSDAPVVILLHPFLGDTAAKEWDGLAVTLAARGFHVLRFDFRGHGKSTVIDKKFWDKPIFPENTLVFPPPNGKPLPVKLENAQLVKEKGYYPMLVNDVIAARVEVDRKNDASKLNTSSVYLIAVGDACPLAMMFLAAEWTRPQTLTEAQAKAFRTLPILAPNTRETTAAKDIAAAVMIAPSYPTSITEKHVTNWTKTFTEMRDKNAVLCIYGDGDAAGKKFSNSLVNEILIANPKPTQTKLNKLTFTRAVELKKSSLKGMDLLSPAKSPDTEKNILDYLTAVEKDRKSLQRVTRNYKDTLHISPSELGVAVKP
jgi:hypothetical protein